MSMHIKETKEEQKNLLIAMMLIVAVLFGFDFIFPSNDKNKIEVPIQPVSTHMTEASVPTPSITLNQADTTDERREQMASVAVQNDFLNGAISTNGGMLTSLELTAYKQTTEENSPNVQLLKQNNYWTILQWVSSNAVVPSLNDTWQVQGEQLTPFSPVKLTYQNQDVKIERTLSMDDAYMFKVTDMVTNLKNTPITVALNGQVNRRMDKESMSTSVVHEGFLSLIDGTLIEKDYSDAEDEKFSDKTTGGWAGITDKYWQTVMIFDQNAPDVDVSFTKQGNIYSAAFQTAGEIIPVGGTATHTTHVFAGAKKLDLINAYEKELNIPKFDLSIDFGWFYFLTRPFLAFLNWLYAMVGNMGVAILIFATLIRIALLPIATKSYESMAKMRKVQPKMKQLQERYKDNRIMLQQEMMNLYKREKINPAGGCLPMLLQIPVFYALYKVLSVSINMRQAPFFGWIHDLSMPDPSSVLTVFGYLDWPIPSILNIGIWPVLMGLTMYIQQKLNPAPTDQTQANIFKWMPIIFTFMLGSFASGLVIYWTWSNVLSIAQQKYIMKKVGV